MVARFYGTFPSCRRLRRTNNGKPIRLHYCGHPHSCCLGRGPGTGTGGLVRGDHTLRGHGHISRWGPCPHHQVGPGTQPVQNPNHRRTTEGAGQIRQSRFDNPFTTGQVIGRMASEVFLFRSLFRNLALRVGAPGAGVTYASAKWLWLFSILFHYALLMTVFTTSEILSPARSRGPSGLWRALTAGWKRAFPRSWSAASFFWRL